jgi:hypothetical protein
MAANKKDRTAAEKLACYERVAEILEDRLALENHFKSTQAPFDDILLVHHDAYREIVRAVFGDEALFFCEIPISRRSRSPRKPAARARTSKPRAGLKSS